MYMIYACRCYLYYQVNTYRIRILRTYCSIRYKFQTQVYTHIHIYLLYVYIFRESWKHCSHCKFVRNVVLPLRFYKQQIRVLQTNNTTECRQAKYRRMEIECHSALCTLIFFLISRIIPVRSLIKSLCIATRK